MPGHVSDRSANLLSELARKYLWWEPIGNTAHAPARVIAQVMNLGTYDDIRRLEAAVGPSRLAEIMAQAEPGWFSPRSWEFWRGRLARLTGARIAQAAPRRSFHDEGL